MAIDLPKSLHHLGNRWLWPSSHWSRHGGTWRKFTRLQYINPITGWYPEISIDIQSLWFIITGWWYTYPSAKNMSSSVGIMTYPKLFLESHKIPWFQSPPTSMGSYVFLMIFLWFSYGFLWFSYGFPMIFLWFSYGFPMVFLWFPMEKNHQGCIPIASFINSRHLGCPTWNGWRCQCRWRQSWLRWRSSDSPGSHGGYTYVTGLV